MSQYLRKFDRSLAVVIGLMMLCVSGAVSATVINTTVSGNVSLYFEDWGHIYNIPGGGNEFDALGRGVAATAVAHSFTVGETVDIIASNCVVDAGPSCTGPDGVSSPWRGLDVYSLIGIWSTSSTSIVPVGAAFKVGSSLSTVAAGTWLFLAENNGVFADNHIGAYDVQITTVPEPGSLVLLGAGLLGIAFARRKNAA